MVVMIVIAQLYGVLQLAVLGWAARSVRWRVLVVGVLAGLYGASVLALLLQETWTRAFAALTGTPLFTVTRIAGYTVDPFIEEITKLLPVVLVYWIFTTVRRQWGATDLVLACAAVGSGFGLAEQLLRFSDDPDRAIAYPGGGWALPGGILSIQSVPGPSNLLTSWLPAGVGGFALLGQNAADAINIHLVWSTLAGLGLALLLRSKVGRTRLIGVGLIALAGLDHAANNAQAGGVTARAFAEPFAAVRHLVWLYPLIALGVAIRLDRQVLHRQLGLEPALYLAGENTDPGIALPVLTRAATARLPWSWLAVTGFIRLRRAYLYGTARDPAGDPGSSRPEVLQALQRLVASLDKAGGPDQKRIWAQVNTRMRALYGWTPIRARITALINGTAEGGRRAWLIVLLWLLLLALPIGYFVIGGQPAFAGVQNLYRHGIVFWTTVAVTIAAGAWTGWKVQAALRALPSLHGAALADRPASAVLLLVMRVGSLAVVATGLLAVAGGTPATGHLVPGPHILDAVGNALLVAGLLLAILALIAAPPLGLVAIAGGGTALVWTGVSAALASELVIATAVGGVGLVLSEAADSAGSGQGTGSGSGSPGGSRGPTGVEQHADFNSFNEAREAARQGSGLGDDAVDFVQKLGPYKGRITGRESPDGLRGWRIDYDKEKGFHVNWWDKTAGAKRASWRYGANRIVNGTENDYWKLLQHFPGR
jgi:hypothetical protein